MQASVQRLRGRAAASRLLVVAVAWTASGIFAGPCLGWHFAEMETGGLLFTQAWCNPGEEQHEVPFGTGETSSESICTTSAGGITCSTAISDNSVDFVGHAHSTTSHGTAFSYLDEQLSGGLIRLQIVRDPGDHLNGKLVLRWNGSAANNACVSFRVGPVRDFVFVEAWSTSTGDQSDVRHVVDGDRFVFGKGVGNPVYAVAIDYEGTLDSSADLELHAALMDDPEVGACCSREGSCVLSYEESCQVLNGHWLGPDTVCDPNPCPPFGACCVSPPHDPADCFMMSWDECAALGGLLLVGATACDPNPCIDTPARSTSWGAIRGTYR
jgi:hypothetical protein